MGGCVYDVVILQACRACACCDCCPEHGRRHSTMEKRSMEARRRCVLQPITVCMFMLCVVGPALAAVPQQINYQGYLESGGAPITAVLPMEFSLYDAQFLPFF